MEGVTGTSQGMQAASRSSKRPGNESFQKESSPANTLIVDSDLQIIIEYFVLL